MRRYKIGGSYHSVRTAEDFPDKEMRTEVLDMTDLIEMARQSLGVPKSSKAMMMDGKVIFEWPDWPKKERDLRQERCPWCYLQNDQGGDEDEYRGHKIGCPRNPETSNLTKCDECGMEGSVRAKDLWEGGGIECTNPECGHTFCF